jgi:hypothetical protein
VSTILDFLTSDTGLFAAIAAAVGVVAAVVGVVQPILARRRESREARANLAMTSPLLSDLSLSSNSYDLRFEMTNTGVHTAVAVAVRLRVLERGPSTTVVPTVTEAPLRVNSHRVKLRPEHDLYDVRARAYGPALPPLAFADGEAEAFSIKLVADEPQRYVIRIEVEWYDTKNPAHVCALLGKPVEVDFPPRAGSGRSITMRPGGSDQ